MKMRSKGGNHVSVYLPSVIVDKHVFFKWAPDEDSEEVLYHIEYEEEDGEHEARETFFVPNENNA